MSNLPFMKAFDRSIGPKENRIQKALRKSASDFDMSTCNLAIPVSSCRVYGDGIEEWVRDILDETGLQKCPSIKRADILLLGFRDVFLHTDDDFPRYTMLVPVKGTGYLSVTDGRRVRGCELYPGMGVVFDNHRPHDFNFTGRGHMLSVCVNMPCSRKGTSAIHNWLRYGPDRLWR